MSQIYGEKENSGILPQIATRDICVAVPNEGNRQNFDNGQSICQYFSTLFGIFWKKFPKCTDL